MLRYNPVLGGQQSSMIQEIIRSSYEPIVTDFDTTTVNMICYKRRTSMKKYVLILIGLSIF